MEFSVRNAGEDNKTEPCVAAYKTGNNEDWTVNFDSLEDLIAFIDIYEPVVISPRFGIIIL
jgi:hypothetical protein